MGTGWKTNGDERNRDGRMVRIIGARHEKLPKTKAAEGEPLGAKLPMKLGFQFANQNSCRQVVRRREEFDEAFSTLS